MNLLIICIVLFLSVIFGKISTHFNFPPVIGQLLVGVIFGPAFINILHSSNLITTFSDLGVIILMFLAGLESDLNLLRKYIKPSLMVATIGVLIPLVTTYLTCMIFNFNFRDSLFLSIVFISTSVSISAEILKEMHVLNTSSGMTIMGAAVADDVIGIILLSLVMSIIGTNQKGFLNQHLIIMILVQIGYFIGLILMIKWIIPWLFTILRHFKEETILALIICFLCAYFAETIGLSSITGAFFAGIAISRTHFKKTINKNISIIGYDFFIPFFFINIGLAINLNGVINHWQLFFVLTILSVLNKLFGAGIGSYLSGFSLKNSFVIGSGMISRGEVALIIVQIGLSSHLISANLYSTAVSAIILTTLISPLILRKGILMNKKEAS